MRSAGGSMLSATVSSMNDPDIRWWNTNLGEEEVSAVSAAIRDRRINQGAGCAELEARIADRLGVPYVAVTSSGTAALIVSMLAAGVRPGDEVIVPALTFIAPAHAARLLGATVKLVDVLRDRPLIDPAALAAVLTPATRAVVAVHLGGRACDIDALRAAVAGRPVRIIEDCAQAFESRDAAGPLGTRGDVAAFSMGITKLITTGEGGFVATRDAGLSDALLRGRNQGALRLADNVFDAPGANFRLTDLQAAMGLVQMDRLDAKIAAVKRVYAAYEAGLADMGSVRLLPVAVDRGELPLWVEVECDDRDRVVALMRKRGIETKPFHPCLARSPHLEAGGEFPSSERFASRGLTLPSGPDRSDADVARVLGALREVVGELGQI